MEKWILSNFDKFCLGMNLRCAWAYRQAPDFVRLGSSLNELMGSYPHLGGLYVEKEGAVMYDPCASRDWQIERISRQDCSISELIADEEKVWKLTSDLDIKGFKQGQVKPFKFSLVDVKDGAVLIVQCAHAMMDGCTFHALMRQWASLYRGEAITPMVVDQGLLPSRDSLSEKETLERVIANGWVKIGFKKMVKMLISLARSGRLKGTSSIEVSQQRLAELKEASGVGANAVLSAIAAKHVFSHFPDRKTFKMIGVADLRGRFTGIGDEFMGNFSQALIADGEFSCELGIGEMAQCMDRQFRAALERAEDNVRLMVCASEHSLPYYLFDASDMNGAKPGTIYVNNQLKLRACELDWGHGLPEYAFSGDLKDMVKLWQPVHDGPIKIIFGGQAAKY